MASSFRAATNWTNSAAAQEEKQTYDKRMWQK
jgi:hypothetical protein